MDNNKTSNQNSKREIDELGKSIRNSKSNLSDSKLELLQAYRVSHKEALSEVFTVLCKHSKKINPSSIVTFRIKRFQSIINKLERLPTLRLSQMADIAGCRCIMKNDEELYNLKKRIEKDKDLEILIDKEKDYIKNPQDDGYTSLHMFVKSRKFNNIIEVQVRSIKRHNWATLVEITDLLFDSRLKEYSENKDLLKLHLLLSKIEEVDIKEKKQISFLISKYNFFERLSEVFSRNYIKVREQWIELRTNKYYKYFLIETNKDQVPKISSFDNFQDAEKKYFEVYKNNQSANIVLTHLGTTNFNQLNIAYSNYTLAFHSFLKEFLDIIENILLESISNKEYFYLKRSIQFIIV